MTIVAGEAVKALIKSFSLNPFLNLKEYYHLLSSGFLFMHLDLLLI